MAGRWNTPAQQNGLDVVIAFQPGFVLRLVYFCRWRKRGYVSPGGAERWPSESWNHLM